MIAQTTDAWCLDYKFFMTKTQIDIDIPFNFLKGFYEYDESIFATVDTRKKGKTQ